MSNSINFTYSRNRGLIEANNIEIFDELRESISSPNKAAKYSPYAPSVICPVSPLGGFLPGLTKELAERIREIDPNVNLTISKSLLNVAQPISYSGDIIMPGDPKFVYRDYQLMGIKTALLNGRGIVLLPTGSGKGLIIFGIASILIKKLNVKNILVLVPNIQLVRQLYGDFKDYGTDLNISMFSSFAKTLTLKDSNVIISNRQWLERHNDELPPINALLIDETHQAKKTNKISKYINKLNTNIRIGFTGTLPDDIEDEWHVKGIIGTVLHTRDVYDLQDKGYLANINITPIKFIHKNKPRFVYVTLEDYKKAFHDEWTHIEKEEQSNKSIIKIVKQLKGNTLVLFDHIIHGNKLFSLLDHRHKYFIDGSIDLNIREDIRHEMETNPNVITIANTRCFGTGINIKAIDNIVLTMHGKGATKIIQSIGRGLRLKAGKSKVNLIDIYHNFKYSEKHFLHRKDLYKKYYDINITNVGEISI